MSKIKSVIFLFLSLSINSFYHKGFSQNTSIGKVTIASPNAAALGKYGDIPVSYHTGIPQISIPIYTIKSGPLTLPISLSYHASGLKVQEEASWVGAGWALNAGGVITRTVIGAPDDKGFYAASTDKGHFSDYGYNSYLFATGPAVCQANGPITCPTGSIYPPQDSYIANAKFDGEPDLYFFNFSGHSGKFYFNDDRTPICEPEQDLKIVPNFPGTATDPRGMIGFTITTTDGIQYVFGSHPADGTPDALDKTYNITTQESNFTNHGAVSSWYLNKIVSADQQFTIKLIYQAENYSYFSLSMFPIPSAFNPALGASNLEYDLDKNFIDGVRLSKITFSNGEVDFNTGNLRQDLSLGTAVTDLVDRLNTDATIGARALGNIVVQSSDVCKKYTLYTSYFTDNSALTGALATGSFPSLNLTSDKYRLKLDSLQETSCDNTVKVPPYKFTYFTETVPRKLSFGIDHWGFYNGVTNNNSLIPTYTIITSGTPTTYPGANRDATWPAIRGGSLQQITYPTGGNTVFDFESNGVYYSTSNYANFYVNGLVVNQFGQAQLTQTISFTTTGSGDCTFNLTNNSTDWSPTFTLKNSSNVQQGASPWILSVSSTLNLTLSLPPGTYTATLAFPAGSTPHGGATASIYQWRTEIITGSYTVGGLRIKTITNNDGFNNPVVTSYGYNYNNTVNGQSSGILFSQPAYVEASRNDIWGIVSSASCNPTGCITCFSSNESYYKSPSSIRPMSSSQGSHIGYAEVYVSQSGNGYSVYKYYSNNGTLPHIYDPPVKDVCIRSLDITTCNPSVPNSPPAPLPFDPMRGELAYQASYNQAGQMIKSSQFYPLYKFDSLTTPGIISRFSISSFIGTTAVGVSTITEYNLQSAKKIMDSTVTYDYDPATGSYVTNTTATYYLSKYHRGITRTSTYSSKGENLLTNYKSSFDYRITNYTLPDQLSTYYSNINSDNTYLNNALPTVTFPPSDARYQNARLSIYINYRYMKAVHRQNLLTYRGNNFTFDPSSPYQTAHTTAKSGADAILKPVLELQDEYINEPLDVNTWRNTSLNNNLVGATYVQYGYSTNPATKVYPTAIKKINLAATSPTYTGSAITSTSITKDSRFADETTVKYYLGNVVEVLPKNGVFTSYIWGNNNEYPIVKAVGIDYNTLLAAYTAVGGNLSLIRGQASLANAQVFTYVYTPMNGMVNETDARGITTSTYQYDALGRVALILDQNNNIIKKFSYSYYK